jgi:hypothetical protein
VDNARGRGAAPRSKVTVFAVTAVIVALGIVAGVIVLVRHVTEQVKGTVHAAGTPAGTFDFAVDDCASGHAFVPGFFGADLRGGGGRFDLRAVDSGDDAQLWLYPPGAKRGATLIARRDCSRWDVVVEWARVTVNRVYTVNGHVRVTCAVGGGTLAADVEFLRCAF